MAWSENKWTVISGLATVLGVIVPVLLFVASRDSKELTVKTVSRAVVVDLTEPALGALKLTYHDSLVTRLTTATVEVSNSGNTPIERRDFERDLLIGFGDAAAILVARVSEEDPKDLRAQLDVGSSTVAIKPLLLNPGDRFRLTIHLQGDLGEPLVDGRISGVTAIQRREFVDSATKRVVLAVFAGIFGAIGLAGYFYLGAFVNPFRQKGRHAVVGLGDVLFLMAILGLTSAALVVAVIEILEISKLTAVLLIVGVALMASPFLLIGRRRARRQRSLLSA